METPRWRKAIIEEIKALETNDTWDVMELSKGKRPIWCKWVSNVKYKPNGTIERYKARLVAKKYTKTYGIDYTETLILVAKLNMICVLLSLATNFD